MASGRQSEQTSEGWQAGGESSCLLVEILDAVDETRGIDGERDAIQATVAHHAGEAVRVVGLAGGTEDSLHDGLRTHIALLQSVLRKERKTAQHNSVALACTAALQGRRWASMRMTHTGRSEGITQAVGSTPVFFNTRCLPSMAFLSTSPRVKTHFSIKPWIIRTRGTDHSVCPHSTKAASERTQAEGL